MHLVLIADRNVLMRKALTQMVSLCGFQCVPVSNVKCALGALEKVSFDILIAGVAPGDHDVPGLVYAARRQQPKLRVIVGKTYSCELPNVDLVNAYVNFPLTLDELRFALGDTSSP